MTILRYYYLALFFLFAISCENKKKINRPIEVAKDSVPTTIDMAIKLSYDSVSNQNGKNINILPTMSFPMGRKNYVHCSNIEYLWNELLINSDKDVKSNIIAKALSESKTWQNTMDIDKLILSFGKPDSVYADVINQYRTKYKITNVSLEKKGRTFWGYSDKSIKFKYEEPFYIYDLEFSGTKVNGFGFTSGRSSIYVKGYFNEQYEILYYNRSGEYIIKLKPAGTTDEIILVMTNRKSSFQNMFSRSQELILKGVKDKKKNPLNYCLNEPDEMKIPIIRFNAIKEYEELVGLDFSSKYGSIESVEQSIKFNFDEKGVALESNVGMVDSLGGDVKPKKIVFDKPFYLYIKEKSAPYPYFNLWINDVGILERNKK